MRVIAREHVQVRIRVLDQHAHVLERECGEAHLLSDLPDGFRDMAASSGCARLNAWIVLSRIFRRGYPDAQAQPRGLEAFGVFEHAAQHHGANKRSAACAALSNPGFTFLRHRTHL